MKPKPVNEPYNSPQFNQSDVVVGLAVPGSAPSPAATPKEVQQKLFLSHAITRLGTQGWLFIAPLVLLRFTPGCLIGPACWGLATMFASALIAPALGAWADQANRQFVVAAGVAAQACAVLGSTMVLLLVLQNDSSSMNLGGLVAFTAFSIVEKLGTAISDVSVKRDWSPRLFSGDMLKRTNSVMSQIDLVTETVGPLLAGLLISLAIDLGVDDAEAAGFVAVGILNALSFLPQLRLLLQIYNARSDKLQPLKADQVQRKANPFVAKAEAWKAWGGHPSGIQFLSMSYALLYLTVLSPHGAFLTAYLSQRGVVSWQLSLLRGGGAMLGVLGVMGHPGFSRLIGGRPADAFAVTWLAGSTILALVAFREAPQTPGLGPALLIFMVAVCVARPGLYAFELGVLNTEQELADARHRAAIGSVDTALTSAATLVMYGSGLILDKPAQFDILINCSACFVTMGAITYWLWMLLFHSHRHRHSAGKVAGDHGHGHDHDRGHGHCHEDVDHPHTLQQQEAMDDGWHEHFHYHPPTLCALL